MNTSKQNHSLVITDVINLHPANNPKIPNLKAFVDVVFNGGLVVKGFKVLQTVEDSGKTSLWIGAPSRGTLNKKTQKMEWNDMIYSPKDSGGWQYITQEILNYYRKNTATKVMP